MQRPRPPATGPVAHKDFYVDLNWKGEEKGTKDAPFRSLGKAMHHAGHDANRNRHDGHSVVLDQFTRLNIIHVADGVYDREVEAYGSEGLRPMWSDVNRHTRFQVQGSYVGLKDPSTGSGQAAAFDWSEQSRGWRTTGQRRPKRRGRPRIAVEHLRIRPDSRTSEDAAEEYGLPTGAVVVVR